MRVIKVDNVKEGMELAKPILDNGNYLLTAGQQNLLTYKNKLKERGINYVYIQDEFSYDIEVNDIISDKTRQQGQKLVEDMFSDISNNSKIDMVSVKNYVSNIIEKIMESRDIMLNLIDIKTTDNYTFSHSVNVTVISILLGKSLGLNYKELEKLGLGAITHDVGKLNIPEDVLKKSGTLTDEEYKIIKSHPRLGFERLKEISQLPSTSLAVVLGHHENYIGNGYPRGISKKNIHLYPRIVAVADVYDALTSDRIYRERWPVSKAVDFIISKSGEKFDPEIVKHFSRYMTLYPNGTQIRLSDGRKAVVIEQNENFPERPLIRILDSSKEEIDLAKKTDIVIEDEILE